MKFLRGTKIKKTILVISDIHMGAGTIINNHYNYLEDFHYEKELIEFLNYHSSKDYSKREVELIINGDFLDFLSVPFVRYFDNEFWSEDASLEKLKIITKAHIKVINAMEAFLSNSNKKIVYIIGNHDAEMIFPSLIKYFKSLFSNEVRDKLEIIKDSSSEYQPIKGVVIKHGHEYEEANNFDANNCIAEDEDGKKYFIPPWGSYYVIKIINKFKQERDYINTVRPIKKFLINGLIYDTLFTIRFMLANIFYFFMVRFIDIFKEKIGVGSIIRKTLNELELFQDYTILVKDILDSRDDLNVLIVGHTHEPVFRPYANGKIFINTGSWVDVHYLDIDKKVRGSMLTYAKVNVLKDNEPELDVTLNSWRGSSLDVSREIT